VNAADRARLEAKITFHREVWVAFVQSGRRPDQSDEVASVVNGGYVEIDRLFSTNGDSPQQAEPSADERSDEA
jgi:hypothetical protein